MGPIEHCGDVDWTGFQVSVRCDDGICLVEVSGKLDQTTSPQLRRALRAAVAGRPRALRVLLSGVPFVDPSGIAALAGGYKQARVNGCGFAVQCPSGPVRRALTVSHLADIVPLDR